MFENPFNCHKRFGNHYNENYLIFGHHYHENHQIFGHHYHENYLIFGHHYQKKTINFKDETLSTKPNMNPNK